jgi:hypothetical protein
VGVYLRELQYGYDKIIILQTREGIMKVKIFAGIQYEEKILQGN